MAKAQIQLIGDKALLNLIRELPKETSKKNVWKAFTRKASRPVMKDISGRMPRGETGILKKSLKYRGYTSRYFGGLGGYIKVSNKPEGVGFTNQAKAHVLVNNRSVKPLQQTQPNWFRDSANSGAGKLSLKILEDNAEVFIQREIKKLLKRRR